MSMKKKERFRNPRLCPICCAPYENIIPVGVEKPYEFALRSGMSDYLDERGVPRFILKDSG